MPFDKIASVYFIGKIYLYFSIGNGQPREPALCRLYRHTFVPYIHRYAAVYLLGDLTATLLPVGYHKLLSTSIDTSLDRCSVESPRNN